VLIFQAMELILTEIPATTAEMERLGVVNKVVPTTEDVLCEAMKIARTIASYSGPAIRLAKQAILAGIIALIHSFRLVPKLMRNSFDDNVEGRVEN
jgi:enoyl-CoA hydratase/carnithine racemase